MRSSATPTSSATWTALHRALRTGELPPSRNVGFAMKLFHRECTPGRWHGEIVFRRGATNSVGTIHGGFLAAILDIAMGYASVTRLEAGESQRTLEIKINFLEGIPPDRVHVEGEVLRRGKQTAYCEGSIRSGTGTLVARASATFAIRRRR